MALRGRVCNVARRVRCGAVVRMVEVKGVADGMAYMYREQLRWVGMSTGQLFRTGGLGRVARGFE